MKAILIFSLSFFCLAGRLAAQPVRPDPPITEARLLAWADSITQAPLRGGSRYISYAFQGSQRASYHPMPFTSTRTDTFNAEHRIRYRLRHLDGFRIEQWRGIGYHILHHNGEPTYIRVRHPNRVLGIESAKRITWLGNGYMTIRRPSFRLEETLPNLARRK